MARWGVLGWRRAQGRMPGDVRGAEMGPGSGTVSRPGRSSVGAEGAPAHDDPVLGPRGPVASGSKDMAGVIARPFADHVAPSGAGT